MKKNDRVILVKGDATKWYDQAIFIVNKNLPEAQMPKDFVAEAEKIIHNYINKKRQSAYGAFASEHKPKPQNLQSLQKAVAAPKAGAKNRKKKKGGALDLFLNLVMILGCLVIVGVLVFGLV